MRRCAGHFKQRATPLAAKSARPVGWGKSARPGGVALGISGVTGHTPKSIDTIIERYLVRTTALAGRAFAKRLESERE